MQHSDEESSEDDGDGEDENENDRSPSSVPSLHSFESEIHGASGVQTLDKKTDLPPSFW